MKSILAFYIAVFSLQVRADEDFYRLDALVTKADSLQGKFAEKREWLKSLDRNRDWCVQEFTDGSCDRREKGRVDHWLAEVDASERCLQTLEALSKAQPENKRMADKWLTILREDCSEPVGSFSDRVPPSIDYEGKYSEAAASGIGKIVEMLPKLPYGPANDSAEAKSLASTLTKCANSFRWGYYVYKGLPKKPDYRLNAEVKGKWDNREDCEIARLKVDAMKRKPLGSDDKCIFRFPDGDVKFNLYSFDLMNSEANEFKKVKALFVNQKMCNEERKKQGKRALSNCKVEAVTICSSDGGVVEPKL